MEQKVGECGYMDGLLQGMAEWLEMLRLAGLEQGDSEVWLVVLYFVSRNMEQGALVETGELGIFL